MTEEPKGSHCPCMATSHNHKPGQCDEPAPPTGAGSVCATCRYYAVERR